jgi:hypothetical protein
MSVAIPTASYTFPDGGVGIRKLAKQPLIPQGFGGIVYLAGGTAAQPISPGVLGSWDDTGDAAFLKGYVAYDLAHKLGQGGNTTSVFIDLSPTHGGGTQSRSALISQHVIEIPKLFTPPSSLRGTLRGAFELANREIAITTSSTYPGVVGVTLSSRTNGYVYVSGSPSPDPNSAPPGSGVASILTRVWLVDHTGSIISTLVSSGSNTASDHNENLQGVGLFSSSSVSLAATTPNDRLSAYLVVEIGFSISASGNNFVYSGAGTWYQNFAEQRCDLSFDDAEDNLMSVGDTVQSSTFLGQFDLSSGLDTGPLSDYDQHLRASSR